jgi:hypothetical protein
LVGNLRKISHEGTKAQRIKTERIFSRRDTENTNRINKSLSPSGEGMGEGVKKGAAMKNSFVLGIEILSITACFVFGILWLLDSNNSYEPAIVVSGVVLALTEIYKRYSPSKPNEHDLQLFEEFCSLFTNGIADFYKRHDFATSFREDHWTPLGRYVDNWNNVEHEFVDKGLENASKKFYSAANKLGWAIANKTVSIGTGYLRSVKPDHIDKPIPDWIRRDAEEINALRRPFGKAYEAFIRLGRKKLYS